MVTIVTAEEAYVFAIEIKNAILNSGSVKPIHNARTLRDRNAKIICDRAIRHLAHMLITLPVAILHFHVSSGAAIITDPDKPTRTLREIKAVNYQIIDIDFNNSGDSVDLVRRWKEGGRVASRHNLQRQCAGVNPDWVINA